MIINRMDKIVFENSGTSDFIYNRFDVIYNQKNTFCLELIDNSEKKYIPVYIENSKAFLGLWLSDIPAEYINNACKYLFREFRNIDTVEYSYGLYAPLSNLNVTIRRDFWTIQLPQTEEQLDARLKSKKRYNIKREKRIVSEQFGYYKIEEYTKSSVPKTIIQEYFRCKKAGYGIDYHMTEEEYLDRYFVSNIYVLKLTDINKMGAILCSCEQGANVYLENLTYDPEYKQYSMGSILYDEYLKILIKKGKKALYLGYGNYVYKTLYGSIETVTYSSVIYRNILVYIRRIGLNKCKKSIKSILRRCYRKLL